MRKHYYLLMALFSSFLLLSCEKEKSTCEKLDDEIATCLDDFCSGQSCLYCQCWHDGHKIVEGNACVEPGPDPDPMTESECQQGLDDPGAVCAALLLSIDGSGTCP